MQKFLQSDRREQDERMIMTEGWEEEIENFGLIVYQNVVDVSNGTEK